jgi:tetratricopeptide (TPR) repeat protein
MPSPFRASFIIIPGIVPGLVSVGLCIGLLAAPSHALASREEPSPVQPVYGAYLTGIVAGALGDSGTASTKLLDVLRTDPDPEVRIQAFLFSTLAGRDEAAKLAAQMDNPLAPLVLGNDAASHGRWSDAAASYTRIANSPLNELLRPLLTAWSQQGAGQTDLALSTLTALNQNSAVAGVYTLHAAMIADLAGRTDQAGRLYQQALTLYPGSDLVFAQSYASFLARTGRPAEAQALVRALTRAIPVLAIAEPGLDASLSKPPVTSAVQGLARSYLTMASLIQQQGPRGRDAENFMLRFALDLQPDLAPARLLLADLQDSGGEPQQALASLRAVPAGDPLGPVAALRAGIIGDAHGDRAEARATLERLVKTFPSRPEPLQALGDLLQDDHQYAAAIDAYDRAIRLMTPLGGEDWPILFARATAYDRDRQWPKAQADLQHALQLSPNQPFLLNYLGYSWVERNQALGDARQMIERALGAKPDDGSIRDSLGWAMYRQNDIAGAVRELERAAEQMPEDPTVNIHLGFAYWAAGRKIEACGQWRWALVLHPGKQDEARIRAALRESARPGGNPVIAADALPPAIP